MNKEELLNRIFNSYQEPEELEQEIENTKLYLECLEEVKDYINETSKAFQDDEEQEEEDELYWLWMQDPAKDNLSFVRHQFYEEMKKEQER